MRRSAAAGLWLALACHREAPPEPPPEPRPVQCAQATTGPVSDGIELRGTVTARPDADATVAPLASGSIAVVRVREGERVARGQEVARLDDTQLREAAAGADATLQKARAELRAARAALARLQRVFAAGIAARQEVDDATARVAAAQASEGEAAAAAAQAHLQIERSVVRSPLDGVVVGVFRHAGDLVDGTAATPVLRIADPTRLEFAADATPAQLVALQDARGATIRAPALPDAAWSATPVAVAPGVDPATGLGSVRLSLTLDPAGPRPPLGIAAIALVRTGPPREAVLVPAAALRSGGETSEVVVCGSDGRAHVRGVERGATADGSVEVRGVAAGELVAVQPVLGLEDGEPLRIEPAP